MMDAPDDQTTTRGLSREGRPPQQQRALGVTPLNNANAHAAHFSPSRHVCQADCQSAHQAPAWRAAAPPVPSNNDNMALLRRLLLLLLVTVGTQDGQCVADYAGAVAAQLVAADAQFAQSLDACPSFRGPPAWQRFLRRIRDKVASVDLLDVVAGQQEGGDHVAVLVEPRRDPCIGLIVREVFHYLAAQHTRGNETAVRAGTAVPWRLHIFHGPDNLEFIKNELLAAPPARKRQREQQQQQQRAVHVDDFATCTEDGRGGVGGGGGGDGGTPGSVATAAVAASPPPPPPPSILDRVTFTDLSTVVERMDAAADVMEARLGALEAASGRKEHFTYASRREGGTAGSNGLPAVPRERWPAFLLRKWREHRRLMDDEIVETGLWNLNRFVYSQVLLDEAFWDAVPAENVLLFQTDAVLCRTGIEDYLAYDYVGAPWYLCDSMYGGQRGSAYLCEAGNGGLSLRKRSVSLRQIRTQLRTLVMEDYQIANWFFKNPGSGRLPSFSEARDIFVETVDTTSKAVIPLGTHKPWAVNYNIRLAEFLTRCAPELQASSA